MSVDFVDFRENGLEVINGLSFYPFSTLSKPKSRDWSKWGDDRNLLSLRIKMGRICD